MSASILHDRAHNPFGVYRAGLAKMIVFNYEPFLHGVSYAVSQRVMALSESRKAPK